MRFRQRKYVRVYRFFVKWCLFFRGFRGVMETSIVLRMGYRNTTKFYRFLEFFYFK